MTTDGSEDPGAPDLVRRYVAFLARRSVPIVIAAVVLFALSLLAAKRLQLRSDFTELLPQDDPELKQLQQIADRIGASSNLVIGIQGPDPAANERFAEALVGNLKRLIAPTCAPSTTGPTPARRSSITTRSSTPISTICAAPMTTSRS